MTRSALPEAPPPPAWIVCLGELREVSAGRVVCPMDAAPVGLERCLDCHHLADLSDDRSPRRSCSLAVDRGRMMDRGRQRLPHGGTTP